MPLTSLTERLVDLESAAGKIDERLTAISSQLGAIKSSVVDPDDVAAALAEFEPVWEVLHSPERTRVVHLVIKAVINHPARDIQLAFRNQCPAKLNLPAVPS